MSKHWCKDCGGSGVKDRDTCMTCGGDGTVIKKALDEPLTRREVLNALEAVANEYGCNGNYASDLVADAFRKLARALYAFGGPLFRIDPYSLWERLT